MAEKKKSFILYADMIGVVKKLPRETAGDLLVTILEYVNDLNPIIDNNILLEIAFEPIKLQLKRDLKTWEQFKDKQAQNGKNGGRPRKAKPKKEKPNNPSLNSESQKSLNVTVNVTDTVNDNVTDNDKKTTNNTVAEKIPRIEYKMCLDVWLKEIHLGWTHDGAKGKALTSLISKIEKKMKEGSREISPQTITDSFRFVCTHLPEWFQDKDLQVINSKFDQVYDQIKNGKSNSKNQRFGKSTVAEVKRVLDASLSFPSAEEIRNREKGIV